MACWLGVPAVGCHPDHRTGPLRVMEVISREGDIDAVGFDSDRAALGDAPPSKTVSSSSTLRTTGSSVRYGGSSGLSPRSKRTCPRTLPFDRQISIHAPGEGSATTRTDGSAPGDNFEAERDVGRGTRHPVVAGRLVTVSVVGAACDPVESRTPGCPADPAPTDRVESPTVPSNVVCGGVIDCIPVLETPSFSAAARASLSPCP